MNSIRKKNTILKYLIIVAVLILIVKYSEPIFAYIYKMGSVGAPLIMGLCVAFALNILMKKLEKIYFPKTKKALLIKSRRAVCIFLSIFIILGIISLLLIIVIPQLINTFSVIIDLFPSFVTNTQKLVEDINTQYPLIAESLSGMNLDVNEILKNLTTTLTGTLSNIVNSSFSFAGAITNGLINFLIALIFSIYVLAQKEKLGMQLNKVMKAFLKESKINKINYVAGVTNTTFQNFVAGQCMEALILGALCTTGMLIFQFPYAFMIGVFIGAMALIPVVGAYLGAAVGAFLILMVNPLQALFFLLFIVILQQLEGNLIYPKVVGSSVGLPGIWVLAAVTVGAGLGGILGMLLGVPITATVYKLFSNTVNEKLLIDKNNAEKEVM